MCLPDHTNAQPGTQMAWLVKRCYPKTEDYEKNLRKRVLSPTGALPNTYACE